MKTEEPTLLDTLTRHLALLLAQPAAHHAAAERPDPAPAMRFPIS